VVFQTHLGAKGVINVYERLGVLAIERSSQVSDEMIPQES